MKMKMVAMSKKKLEVIKGGSQELESGTKVPELDKRVETASTALLRYWFPKRLPEDIEKWAEIAYNDASAVIKALEKKGYLK